MKPCRVILILGLLAALAPANVALAQVQTSGPTNFPMVGVVRGQTLLLNLVVILQTPA